MLSNLQVILLDICFDIKSFQNVFICCHTLNCIIIYYTSIILNILDKIANYIEFREVIA